MACNKKALEITRNVKSYKINPHLASQTGNFSRVIYNMKTIALYVFIFLNSWLQLTLNLSLMSSSKLNFGDFRDVYVFLKVFLTRLGELWTHHTDSITK